MKTSSLKSRLGLALVVLAAVGLAGCNNSPAAVPIDQRKPGQDISPADRTDKRGGVPPAETSAPGGK